MNTGKSRKNRITISLVAGSFLAAELCFVLFGGILEVWNARTVDQLFTFRSLSEHLRPAYDDTIVHIDIDNSTIQRLNNFYLSYIRSYYAQVVRNLAAMETSIQAYDFIFAAPANVSDDGELIEATRRAGNVYYGLAYVLSDEERKEPVRHSAPSDAIVRYLDATGWEVRCDGDCSTLFSGVSPLITFPSLASSSRGLGWLSVRPDRDGVFRRSPLLVRWGGKFYPSLPFRIVCDYLGVPPGNVLVKPGRSITLEGARRPGGPMHDIVIPIDRKGNMRVNFIGTWERLHHYNFTEVYHASRDRDELAIWREELAGKIVLVSDVSTGSTDVGTVPTDANFPLSGLHANVLHTILSEEFLRELSRTQMLLVELLLACAVVCLSLRCSSLTFSLGTVGLAAAYAGSAALLFLYGHLIVHIVRPLLLLTFVIVSVTAHRYISEEREKLILRKTFEAYFPPSVVDRVMASPDSIASMSRRKELTILFSDIKSFTTYSASLPPDQIRTSLNEYFDAMVQIVFNYEGTVDKYIGDGLMVFFGDLEPGPDHALRCVRAAVDMQKRVRELQGRWRQNGGIPVRIRIGINTGEVVVGNMGSARRLSYTVLGSAVNLAQRLESNAPVDGILISERTYELVKDHVGTRPLGQIRVKGIEDPVTVYEVPVD